MDKQFDYLIVGAGLFGAVFADLATAAGKKVLVVEKRNAIGGNLRTEEREGVQVHLYGPHILHTSDAAVWNYLNSFGRFNRFTYHPVANFKGKIYHLPISLQTCYEVFGTANPADAKRQVAREIAEENVVKDVSAESHALATIGRSIYKTLVKGYIEKEWNRDATTLPTYLVGQRPISYSFDTTEFTEEYQGVPVDGYTPILEKMLSRAEVRLGVDFLKDRQELSALADKVVYTGPLDQYFDCKLGMLEYRSLVYKTKVMDGTNYQGTAVMYYTDRAVPYTRVIEHRFLTPNSCNSPKTVVSFEYPKEYRGPQDEPYYPIQDNRNTQLAQKYLKLAADEPVLFGGRLATFANLSMGECVSQAFTMAQFEGLVQK